MMEIITFLILIPEPFNVTNESCRPDWSDHVGHHSNYGSYVNENCPSKGLQRVLVYSPTLHAIYGIADCSSFKVRLCYICYALVFILFY